MEPILDLKGKKLQFKCFTCGNDLLVRDYDVEEGVVELNCEHCDKEFTDLEEQVSDLESTIEEMEDKDD